MQKLYCYVDETGQDTGGLLFSVCCIIVLTLDDKEKLEKLAQDMEARSSKHSKWQKTDNRVKHSFLELLCDSQTMFTGHLFIEHFFKTRDYTNATVEAVAKSIKAFGYNHEPAIIYIDGLNKSQVGNIAVQIRKHGIRTEKVKGLKDEQSALIRLCDAMAGFVRDYLEGETYAKEYFLKLLKAGLIQEV